MSDIREQVRDRYAKAADISSQGGCCNEGCGCDTDKFGSMLYQLGDRAELPDAAVLASLGCGNPTAVAQLAEGEVVLDLGSGGGIDVLLSAKRVGRSGKAYGLDMTDEMLELANRNKAEAGVENVEFLKGYIEDIPLPDSSVDVVISNCVINLSADKPAVVGEMFRVLAPGGRVAVSDIISSNELSPDERAQRGSYVGCIAGALSFEEYEKYLRDAGFQSIAIEPTHQVADGMFSATVGAAKP